MLNYKIKFAKKSSADEISEKTAFDMIEDYWGTLKNNGQVVGGFDVFLNDGIIYLTTVIPTIESLSNRYNNNYVKERYEKLTKFFDVEFMLEGENIEYPSSCVCEKPSWYFLYHQENTGDSPVICGDCHKPIPLYKLPYIFNEEEHYSVLSWYRAKTALFTLWEHGLWDRFTYGEISHHNSKINREGRKICKEYEKKLGAPFYYYLYYFRENYNEDGMITPKGLPYDIPQRCPQCGGTWIDDSEFCICEKCRLITDSPEWS